MTPPTRRNPLTQLKAFFETVSPIIINPSLTSLTIGISRRFFLFDLIKRLTRHIETDPRLNFISALKYYKALGKFLHGELRDIYRDRESSYIKDFFIDVETYRAVRADLEWAYKRNPNIKMTITKRGVVLYDNYRPNHFNILLLTPHSGTHVPKLIATKQTLTSAERCLIEDTASQRLYGEIVLSHHGIWIDTKLSRFACDYNRTRERAIYDDQSEPWFEVFWREPLIRSEREWLLAGYDEFYFTLQQLIDTHRFNIILDGHTMLDEPGRADVSFGTQHIPRFYMPIVRSLREQMRRRGHTQVVFDAPFGGGNILRWCKERFPDVFICSMEINKRLYMKTAAEVNEKKVGQIAADLVRVFDIEEAEVDLDAEAVSTPTH